MVTMRIGDRTRAARTVRGVLILLLIFVVPVAIGVWADSRQARYAHRVCLDKDSRVRQDQIKCTGDPTGNGVWWYLPYSATVPSVGSPVDGGSSTPPRNGKINSMGDKQFGRGTTVDDEDANGRGATGSRSGRRFGGGFRGGGARR